MTKAEPVHEAIPEPYTVNSAITRCGIECWIEKGISGEATIVSGDRIEIQDTLYNRKVTCKKCLRAKAHDGQK